jgi:hypothetical protein
MGILGVALIQSITIGLIMMVAGIPLAGVWALLVLVLGIAQLPIALITLPAILWLWVGGDYSPLLAGLYSALLFVAGLIDNVLKPIMLGRGVEAPMPVVLLGALGGMVSNGSSIEVNVDYTSILMQEPDAEPASSAMLKGQDLIDNFIEQSAGSETLAVVEEDDLMQESDAADEVPEETDIQEGEDEVERIEESSDENYFTETLAKIYVKQQRYDKALEIIKKLNLKYPKKNAYFADQIRFLEKLIINAKSK